jgi:hypothetical protein
MVAILALLQLGLIRLVKFVNILSTIRRIGNFRANVAFKI